MATERKDLVAAALAEGRRQVLDHMTQRLDTGATWHEETLTDIYLSATHPVVTFQDFNRKEEGRNGADWLWWLVDGSGQAFGMLVQAKLLKRTSANWTVDFHYKKGGQLRDLRTEAARLEVMPAYVVYTGPRSFRHPGWCDTETDDHKWRCIPSSVLFVPTRLVPSTGGALADNARIVRTWGQPVEWLPEPPSWQVERIFDSNAKSYESDFRRFLTEPQVGARRVAKQALRTVAQHRKATQYSATSEAVSEAPLSFLEDPDSPPVFLACSKSEQTPPKGSTGSSTPPTRNGPSRCPRTSTRRALTSSCRRPSRPRPSTASCTTRTSARPRATRSDSPKPSPGKESPR